MSVLPGRLQRNARAFTLTELIVVITVLAILSLILIPVVAKVRASAQSTHCMSNLQQIGRAFTLYAQDHRSLLPAPVDMTGGSITPWYVAIHSYTGTPWKDDFTKLAPVFTCPTWASNDDNVPEAGDIGYAMSAVLGMGFEPNRPVTLTGLQQPSRTIVVLELTRTTVPYFPESGESAAGFATTYTAASGLEGCDRHSNAANYLFADGHVGHHVPGEAATFLKKAGAP